MCFTGSLSVPVVAAYLLRHKLFYIRTRSDYWCKCMQENISPNFSCFVTSRHVATRHDTLSSPCILTQEKVVACDVALVGHLGATGSSRRSRQARLARHVFNFLPEVVPEIYANCKSRAQQTKLVHASTTASS